MAETTTKQTGIQVVVVTPEATVLETQASFVALPLFDGQIGIGQGRGAMIGRLGFGEMRIVLENKETEHYYVDGGFVQVADNVVSVLTNRSVKASELDADKLQEQLETARSRKASGEDELDVRDRMVNQARAQLRVTSSK